MNTVTRMTSGLLKGSSRFGRRNMSAGGHHEEGVGPGIVVGKKQLEQFKTWIPSLAVYGAASFITMVYVTDWRVITDFIPIYNGKYHDNDEE